MQIFLKKQDVTRFLRIDLTSIIHKDAITTENNIFTLKKCQSSSMFQFQNINKRKKQNFVCNKLQEYDNKMIYIFSKKKKKKEKA